MSTVTNVDLAPRLSEGAAQPSTRFGAWLRARLAAYVAMNEEQFRVPARALAMDVTVH